MKSFIHSPGELAELNAEKAGLEACLQVAASELESGFSFRGVCCRPVALVEFAPFRSRGRLAAFHGSQTS